MRSDSEGEEEGEGRSDQVFTRGGISEVKAEEAYIFFLHNLIAGQKLNIPYRATRSRRNDPKWMTNKLKYIIGLKRNIKRLRQDRTTKGSSILNYLRQLRS